jgi:hypothetical protein
MRWIGIVALAGAFAIAACSPSAESAPAPTASAASAPAPTASAASAPAPTASAASAPAPTASAAAVSTSVVCEFYPGVETMVADAAGQSMSGGNAAAATRDAINAIQALAAKATDPTEKKDLTTLADTMDSAVMAGGSFSDWDPAFKAFHAKYGPQCGQVVLTPAP